tara:strand:+ start:4326 stop:5090 length:765 start_codon:yes stop_codon:yes gene_type:complete
MISITYAGRLGNNLFQYAAAYIFAKKFNLKISTGIVYNIFNLPSLTSNVTGDATGGNIINVDDNNFMALLESKSLIPANYHFVGYYQNRDFILKYANEIRSLFNLTFVDTSKNEVFVAYRIGDIENLRQMLPIEYYREALQNINAKSGYITSDTLDHPNVIQLANEFNLKLYNNSPLEKINFAKNFNNLVLSEGSFSWWIGFLSNAKNIYYNERPRFWHGDMFVLPDWIPLKYDWCPTCVGLENKLKCNKIINI